MLIDVDSLQGWTAVLLESWGANADSAAYVADTLVEANLRGVDSHGVLRLPSYHKRVRLGLVDMAAEPRVRQTAPATALVDGSRAPGQLVARAATESVTGLAAKQGVGAVGACHSAHFGAAGYYARAIADAGMIGLVCSNSEPGVLPFGGRAAFLGTNPLAIAAPAEPHPVCLDMATSAGAWGRVFAARAAGEALPPGWFADTDGNPTTDPDRARIALPAAGPKGYGLAFMIEILAGALTGAALVDGIGNIGTDLDRPQDVGHLFVAIDPTHFIGAQELRERDGQIVHEAHRVPAAEPGGEVLAPGEPEERVRAERLAKGIELPYSTVSELEELSRACGVPSPFSRES
jgi:LDH2 family malate/lactate/ureidoglycolate dehydrogenase